METLQAKIERLNAELAEINMHEVITQDLTDRRNQIADQLSDAEYQLKQQQEQEQEHQVREQQFVEHVGSISKLVQDTDPFGKMFPRDPFERMFSLTEYGEMQKQYNGDLIGILESQQTELFNKHKEELAQKDSIISGMKEQVRAGEERETQLKRQNDELQQQVSEAVSELEVERHKREITEANFHKIGESHQQRNAEVAQLKSQVEELQQLAEANKPKETAPSQSLTERLQSLKPVKSLKELSPDEMIRRFEERQANGGKVALSVPEIVAPPIPSLPEVAQPGNTFPQAEPESNTVHPSEEVAKEGITFPTSEQSDGLSVDRNGAVQEIDGQAVTREEFETLKSRVDALETSKGMVA